MKIASRSSETLKQLSQVILHDIVHAMHICIFTTHICYNLYGTI